MSKPWAGVLIHIWQLCVTEAPNFVPPLTIVSHNGFLWFIFGIRRNVGVKMLYTLTSGFIFIHLRVGTLYILLFCLCIGKATREARSRSKTQVSRGRARSLSPEIVASRPILCGNYSLFFPSLALLCRAPCRESLLPRAVVAPITAGRCKTEGNVVVLRRGELHDHLPSSPRPPPCCVVLR